MLENLNNVACFVKKKGGVIYMLRNKFSIIAIMATSILLSFVAGCGTNTPENVIRNYLSIVVDAIKTGTKL